MSAARLALLSIVLALALSALLLGLMHVSGADPRQVWAAFMVSLPSHLGALLSLVVVGFVGILFAYALGWLAMRLFTRLFVEAIKPVTAVVHAAQSGGAAALQAGASVVQSAADGAAMVGNGALGLVRQGVQYIPGVKSAGVAAPRSTEQDTKL